MRPVCRGPHPDGPDGQPREFHHYSDARLDLIERLGYYCSYCERPLTHVPEVEHVQPKSRKPALSTVWDNLLLGCKNCNSSKLAKPVRIRDYYWPDRDNTGRAFRYSRDGKIAVAQSLTTGQTRRAQRTMNLTGLGKPPSDTDWRLQLRVRAWGVAELAFRRLAVCDTPEMREQIAAHAADAGFFSVWMTVFREDRDMLQRFISSVFTGTARDCFNEDCIPIPRPGGAL